MDHFETSHYLSEGKVKECSHSHYSSLSDLTHGTYHSPRHYITYFFLRLLVRAPFLLGFELLQMF